MHTSIRMERAFSTASALEQLIKRKPLFKPSFNHFPRDIGSLVLDCLEIPVIQIPHLTLHATHQYLCILSGEDSSTPSLDDRPLLGLLHVGPPVNIVFLRADLPAHIANYVLAHELAHFVGDIFSVQGLWLKSLPDQTQAVEEAFNWQNVDPWLDLQIAVKGLPTRPRAITGRKNSLTRETSEREVQADLTAREILAPWDETVRLFSQGNEQEVVSLLRQRFGLPLRIAVGYYDDLRRCLNPPPNTTDRLFRPLM